MAGKEKEDMKRKGKQRPVGEMAIRWIAKKKVSPAWVGSPPPPPYICPFTEYSYKKLLKGVYR
jgi:hypothetical protein